jgi:hypothetical protein
VASGAPLVSPAAVSPEALCRLGPDEFALAVKGPVRRVVPAARFVPGGLR